MAIFPNDLLRDLFQNNIDFVSKQIGRILDELYGEQATENSPLEYQPLILHAVTARGENYGRCFNDMSGSWQETPNEYFTFTVDINETNIHIYANNALPYPYGRNITSAQIEKIENTIIPAYLDIDYVIPYSEYNIVSMSLRNGYIRAYNSNNQSFDIGFTKVFSASENDNRNITLNYLRLYDDNQTYTVNQQENYRTLTVNPANAYITDTAEFRIYPFKGDIQPSSLVLLPDSDSNGITNVFNDYNTYEYNYNGDTVYNYYSDDGDLIINGGGVGVSPVVGLGYADFKLILDSLIDELNLEFNFGGDGSTEPLQYAPTWDELHYIDQGSFYITPIEQIDPLPVAPDIADTVIDVSEPLDMLSYGFGALLSAFDSLGVTLTLTFTFLACLVINKLRGD